MTGPVCTASARWVVATSSANEVKGFCTAVNLYQLSPTRIQHNERLGLPGASLGRLHAKTAVIDQSTVYIGSVNLDPRSENENTELGLFARCPELAKEVIRVINISKLQSSYRLRFAPDSQTLEHRGEHDSKKVAVLRTPLSLPLFVFPNPLQVYAVLHVSRVLRHVELQALGIAAQMLSLQVGLIVE